MYGVAILRYTGQQLLITDHFAIKVDVYETAQVSERISGNELT